MSRLAQYMCLSTQAVVATGDDGKIHTAAHGSGDCSAQASKHKSTHPRPSSRTDPGSGQAPAQASASAPTSTQPQLQPRFQTTQDSGYCMATWIILVFEVRWVRADHTVVLHTQTR